MEDHSILRWIDGYYFVIPPKPWDIKLGILHKPGIHILSVYCWCYLLWFIGSPEQGSCEHFWSKLVHCPLSWSLLLSLTFHIFIIFSRTTGPISTKLGTKHPWVKGIQVCSNEGPHPFPRGDNYEIAKYIDEIKKSSSPEPLG